MRKRDPDRWLLALAILSGTTASAQDRGQPSPAAPVGLIMLLSWPTVQEELKLDASQIKESELVILRMKEKLQAQRAEIQKDRASKSAEMARPVVAEALQTIEKLLSPEDLKRLKEINFQSRGFQVLDDPDVKAKLNLTAEQISKVGELRKEMTSTTALVARDRRDDPQTAMNNAFRARQAAVARIPTLLDENQKKVWSELSGKPFSIP